MKTVVRSNATSSNAVPHSGLNEEQIERLGLILDDLLSAAESGVSPDVESACLQSPDLAESIRYYMRSLQLLQNAKLSELSFAGSSVNVRAALGELGDFKLVREIGRGGMGIVYEAQQKSLVRRVALKTLPFAAILDARQIARFQNEAQAAASLHHPNIVPVFSVGCDRGTHFYSMQYIDGISLDHVIEQLRHSADATLPPRATSTNDLTRQQDSATHRETAATLNSTAYRSTIVSIRTSHDIKNIVRLIVQAARAIHYAHQHGIVHRDIKPSNLLVNSEGKLWVTDFGLAQFRLGSNADPKQANLTRSGDFLGTLKYMSPEQALGKSILVDHRSDIYSLGVTLYELLTLKSVIDGTDRLAMLQQIGQIHPIEPRCLNAAIPTTLETIILKSLAKSREDRYSSAEEFADDLDRFLAGEMPLAKRPTWMDYSARFVRQYPKSVGGSLIALVLMLICSLAFASVVQRKNQQILTARNRANQHLAIANEVVHRFGPMQIQELELLQGSEEMRLAIARRAVDYFQSFVAYAADDATLQRDVANALCICGELDMQLGNAKSSISCFQKAIPIFERLKNSNERSAEETSKLDVELAICRNNLAVSLSRIGEFKNAKLHLEDCLRSLVSSTSDTPEKMPVRACEVLTRLNIGQVAVALGDSHRGKMEFARAMDLGERLRLEPSFKIAKPFSMRKDLSSMLVSTMLEISQLPQMPVAQSRQLIELALQNAERLVGSEHTEVNRTHDQLMVQPMFVRDVNMCRVTLGTHLLAHGEANEALTVLETAVRELRKLQAAHPSVIQFDLDYATALNNLGQCELALNKLDEAERVLGQSRDRLTQCLASTDGYHALSYLGGVLNNLSIISELRGDHDESIDRIRQAIEFQKQAIHRAPDSEHCAQLLRQHQLQFAHLQETSIASPLAVP